MIIAAVALTVAVATTVLSVVAVVAVVATFVVIDYLTAVAYCWSCSARWVVFEGIIRLDWRYLRCRYWWTVDLVVVAARIYFGSGSSSVHCQCLIENIFKLIKMHSILLYLLLLKLFYPIEKDKYCHLTTVIYDVISRGKNGEIGHD